MQVARRTIYPAETAFFVAAGEGFELRWFTPVAEVDLCGHATLAAAHVLFEHLGYAQPVITFSTRSGNMRVQRQGPQLAMDFPAIPATACAAPEALVAGLGRQPLEVLAADDYLAVFASEAKVRAITPNHGWLSQLDLRGVIVSARATPSTRQPFLCAQVRHPRRPGHRLGALHSDALLGRQDSARMEPRQT